MNESFKTLMGVKKLDKNSLPGYPMGIGEDTETWPRDPATRKKLLRFDWRAGKQDDAINSDGIQKVADRIRAVGPQMYPTASTLLEEIIPGQIEKVVRAKWMRLAGEFRKADKKRKRQEDDDWDDEVEVVDGGLDRAQMNSRVQSVSQSCHSEPQS